MSKGPATARNTAKRRRPGTSRTKRSGRRAPPPLHTRLGLDKEACDVLRQQMLAALQATARSARRDPGGLARVRALRREAPASAVAPLGLVAVVLEVRDAHLASETLEGDDRTAWCAAADRLLAHLSHFSGDDVAARGRAAQADAARDALTRLLRLTPDGVLTLRASGRVGMWSAGASRLTGRRRWEVQRMGPSRLFPESDTLATLLSEIDKHGRVSARELRLAHASRVEVPVRVDGVRIRRRSGGARLPDDPDRYLLLFHDLTEVHHIRERLIETEKLSAMAKIAGSVAHEFRNPLNSLFLSTDLLEDELSGRKAVQESIAPTLAAIREEIERLNQIITHYLSLSRISGAEPEILGLGEVVRDFVDEHRAQAEERKVGLRIRTDGNDHRIQVDPNQLRRVLVNLVENAIDAVGEGADGATNGRAGVVTLMVRRMRRSVKLTVKDNGPGIPDDARDRVFEPFFTSKAGGSGLGLYLVREIVLASGGTMSLSSGSSRGTSVSIRWPCVDTAGT